MSRQTSIACFVRASVLSGSPALIEPNAEEAGAEYKTMNQPAHDTGEQQSVDDADERSRGQVREQRQQRGIGGCVEAGAAFIGCLVSEPEGERHRMKRRSDQPSRRRTRLPEPGTAEHLTPSLG